MTERILKPELASLVHQVELDKAGWWDRAVKGLIVYVLWLTEDPVDMETVCESLKTLCHVDLDVSAATRLAETMSDSGELVCLGGSRYKISEAHHHSYEQQIREGEELERAAKERFTDILAECCDTIDAAETWPIFQEQFLLPLTRELGARMYEMVSGTVMDFPGTTAFREFIGSYSVKEQQALRDAVIAYLDPKHPAVRSYVLRNLNAYFFLEATSLSEDTLRSLAAAVKKRPRFSIFVDTNFVFSVLGVHENPSNEAAQALLDLAAQLAEAVDVKFYVLPPTLDETRTALCARVDALKGLRLHRNQAEAALAAGLTGFMRRYAEECNRTGIAMSVEEFFEPYVSDLMSVLRGKGIEIFQDSTDGYSIRQDVIDDILAQQEYEKKRERPKTYEELRHDLVLWHFTLDHRPPALESPLGAQFWIVTIDYRFLGFDAFKRGSDRGSLPVCLHPTALIQMLQFWVPRSEEAERAMMGSIRLPFLFHEFDPESERVTVNILRSLNRFERSEDLTSDTVGRVLMNTALRQRIRGEPSTEEQISLVREALVEEDEKRLAELTLAQAQVRMLEEAAAAAAIALDDAGHQERIARERAETAEARLRQETQDRTQMEGRLSVLEAEKTRRDHRGEFIEFASLALVSFALAAGLLYELCRIGATTRCALVLLPIPLVGYVLLADWLGQRYAAIAQSRLFNVLHRFRIWVATAFGLLAYSTAGCYIYDLLKSILK